ncbi:MAG: TIGR03016 family PEP-CTERM system-associated outer membrane protein [Burkholderiaceae bacterium]
MDMDTARRSSAAGLIGIAISVYGASSFAQSANPWQTLDLLGLRYLNTPPPDPQSGIATALGVRGGATFSDNLNLGPKGNKVSGTILEISPYVYASVERPKLQGKLYYSLRNFYNTESTSRLAARHELQAMGLGQLGNSNFWLSGRASVFDINSSPFFTSSFDPSTSSNNRSRYQRYDFTPYYLRGTPDTTQYMLMYGATYVDIGRGNHVTRNTGLGKIRSPLKGTEFGWNALAQAQRYDYQSGYSYHRNDVQIGLQYEFSSTLMAGITANYANSDRLRSASGKTGGWGPGAYMAWRPTEHTSLSAATIENYYGNSSRLRISQRASSWVFGASYDRSVVDYSQGILMSYDSSLVTGGSGSDPYNPGGNATTGQPDAGHNQQNVVPIDQGSALAGGIVSAPLIWMRTAQVSVGLIRPRENFSFTLFQVDRHGAHVDGETPAISGGLYDLDQRGIVARIQHKLTPISTVNLISRAVRSETETNSTRSTLIQHLVYYNQRLNEHLAVGIGYRYSHQTTNGDSLAWYTENAVLIGADYRF